MPHVSNFFRLNVFTAVVVIGVADYRTEEGQDEEVVDVLGMAAPSVGPSSSIGAIHVCHS